MLILSLLHHKKNYDKIKQKKLIYACSYIKNEQKNIHVQPANPRSKILPSVHFSDVMALHQTYYRATEEIRQRQTEDKEKGH